MQLFLMPFFSNNISSFFSLKRAKCYTSKFTAICSAKFEYKNRARRLFEAIWRVCSGIHKKCAIFIGPSQRRWIDRERCTQRSDKIRNRCMPLNVELNFNRIFEHFPILFHFSKNKPQWKFRFQKQPIAQIYLLIMQRTLERGVAFIGAEQMRLQQLLDGKISDQKRMEINQKLNILSSFNVIEKFRPHIELWNNDIKNNLQ